MERKPYPSELQDRFIIRMPDGMRDKLAQAAKLNGRSINAEIVARLQKSIDLDGTGHAKDRFPDAWRDELRLVMDEVFSQPHIREAVETIKKQREKK